MESLILLDSDHKFKLAKQSLVTLWDGRKEQALHQIVINEYEKNRTLSQNAYYWVAIVTPFAKHCGFTQSEMHEVLLGEVFGLVQMEFRGRKRETPRKRSSKLNAAEFADYIENCHRIAAEQGLYIQPYEGTM